MQRFTLLLLVAVLIAVVSCGGGHGGRGRGGRGRSPGRGGSQGGRPIFRQPGRGGHHGDRDGSSSDRDSSSDHSDRDSDRGDRDRPHGSHGSHGSPGSHGSHGFRDQDYTTEEGDFDWMKDLTTDDEMRRGEVPKDPYGSLLGVKMHERRREMKRGIVIGSTVIGVSLLLLFIMLAVYFIKRPCRAAAEKPYEVKDAPPVYAPDELPSTFEKKPLGDGVVSEAPSGDHTLTGVDNLTYEDPALPTYSSLDVRKQADPVPLYDFPAAHGAPGVHHM